jgi:hypothetical protein
MTSKLIKASSLLLVSTLVTSGCAFKQYPTLTKSETTSFLSLERKVSGPLLGSTTFYTKVNDEYSCGRGTLKQEQLAVQDRGNPLISEKNPDGLYVNSESDFRISIKHIAGIVSCETITTFDVHPSTNYKIEASANVMSSQRTCSAKLLRESENGHQEEVKWKQSKQC